MNKLKMHISEIKKGTELVTNKSIRDETQQSTRL